MFATTFIYGLAAANFYAAYEIKMGKDLSIVEMRPSYTQRFKDAYNIMNMKPGSLGGLSDQERQAMVERNLQLEEERQAVREKLERR